jgi:hypothetical protein
MTRKSSKLPTANCQLPTASAYCSSPLLIFAGNKTSRQEAKSQRFISSSNFDETASFLAVTALFMISGSSKLLQPTANCLLPTSFASSILCGINFSRQEAKSRRFISSSNFDETASFLAVTPLFITRKSSKLPTNFLGRDKEKALQKIRHVQSLSYPKCSIHQTHMGISLREISPLASCRLIHILRKEIQMIAILG